MYQQAFSGVHWLSPNKQLKTSICCQAVTGRCVGCQPCARALRTGARRHLLTCLVFACLCLSLPVFACLCRGYQTCKPTSEARAPRLIPCNAPCHAVASSAFADNASNSLSLTLCGTVIVEAFARVCHRENSWEETKCVERANHTILIPKIVARTMNACESRTLDLV